MNVVVKAGSTSVLLRDALRRPLAELELGGVKAGLRKLPKGVMQVRPLGLYVASVNSLYTKAE